MKKGRLAWKAMLSPSCASLRGYFFDSMALCGSLRLAQAFGKAVEMHRLERQLYSRLRALVTMLQSSQ